MLLIFRFQILGNQQAMQLLIYQKVIDLQNLCHSPIYKKKKKIKWLNNINKNKPFVATLTILYLLSMKSGLILTNC